MGVVFMPPSQPFVLDGIRVIKTCFFIYPPFQPLSPCISVPLLKIKNLYKKHQKPQEFASNEAFRMVDKNQVGLGKSS